MFCLISRYKASPENLSEIGRIFNEEAIPLVSRQQGFKCVYLLAQPHGSFMVFNICGTKEQAEAWPQNPEHQQILAKLKPMLSGAPLREGFEVRAHHVRLK